MRFSLLLCAAALAAPAAQANELLRVYELATQNDPTLAAAAAQRSAGIEARPQALSAFLPQVTGSYGYTEGNSEGSQSFGGFPAQTFDSDTESKGTTLTLNQAVFNWEALQRLRQAGDQVALSEAAYRAAEQGLALRVAEAYFGILSSADNLRSAQAENKAVERQLEQAQKRFEVGLSAITDVQEAQARFDLTVAQVIVAEQALASAKEQLSTITGAEADRFVGVQEDIPLPAPDPADVNAWVNTARENNLELLIASLNADAAERGVEVARAKHFPTVGAQINYQDGSRNSGSQFGESTSTDYGVQLNVPIFSGLATQSGVRAAKATHDQREAEYKAKQRGIDKQTRDAYQGVLAGAAQVKALKQAVLSSTTALEASETGLTVGARTAVDVLNAQQQLYSAQRNYSKARYDYLLSVLRLKASAGRLGANDLAEVDRLLIQ